MAMDYVIKGVLHGFLIGGFWMSGFYCGLKTKIEDYERKINEFKN